MADDAQSRPRTNTRARAEAPPGMMLTGDEGRQSIGRYEVIKTIGKGAMGVVYKARDPLLDRVVAVKTIAAPQQQGRRVRSAFLERFQREAKAAAKMSHPAIVTIFDVGVDEDSGAPFMVLEYLPGESLADRLDRVRFPLARCVQIGLDLSSALSFAHRQRIVHRDVKPANVLHAGDNRWKLADFGIARLPDSDLTQVGIFMGTPGYSPPEAIREGRYTPQADVFAWGAVMYELMSGRIPYEGPDTKTTNSYVVQGNAPPPTRHDPSIPEPLALVAMTALQPSDVKRFKDASEAEQALREAWDRCLTQGLVHPSVLAMDETPHDKAPLRMHESRNVSRVSPPVTPAAAFTSVASHSFSDSTEHTAIDEKIPQKAAAIEQQQRSLVVESTKPRRGEDDDPTTLMARDALVVKLKPSAKAAPPPDTIDEAVASERDGSAHDVKAEEKVRRGAQPVVGRGVAEHHRRTPMPRALLLVIALVLLLGAAAIGMWVGGGVHS